MSLSPHFTVTGRVSPAFTYPRRRHAIHRAGYFWLGVTLGAVLAVAL